MVFNGCSISSFNAQAVAANDTEKRIIILPSGNQFTYVGGSLYLEARFQRSVDSEPIIWSSDNPTVADVDENGVVTGVSLGTATITASNESGETSAICTVDILNNVIPVTGASIVPSSTNIAVGSHEHLVSNILPLDIEGIPNYEDKIQNLTGIWESSKPSVATVDKYGLVEAISYGTAIITMKTADGGFVSQCRVKVYETTSPDTPSGIEPYSFWWWVAVILTFGLFYLIFPPGTTDPPDPPTVSMRYVSQLGPYASDGVTKKTPSSKFKEAYWKNDSYGDYIKIARKACSVACGSMALYSIGIDKLPYIICKKNLDNSAASSGAYMTWSYHQACYTSNDNSLTLTKALENFNSDPEKYALPIIRVTDQDSHYIVIISETNKAGTYNAYDPAQDGDSNNKVTYETGVNQVIQYYINN